MEIEKFTLEEAATRFLASLSPELKESYQREVNKFVRWYGRDCLLSGITAPQLSNYVDKAAEAGGDAARVLEPVKAFLTYARKEKLITASLAIHIKVKKAKLSQKTSPGRPLKQEAISQEGYTALKDELAKLKKERPKVAEELRRAAADKDFRENAPLEAARDYQGQLEARIRGLEHTIHSSVVMGQNAIEQQEESQTQAEMGKTVFLKDLSNGESLRYTLVHPSEVAIHKGKLSVASPTGKAMLGKREGEVVEVQAPVGILRYQIEKIES